MFAKVSAFLLVFSCFLFAQESKYFQEEYEKAIKEKPRSCTALCEQKFIETSKKNAAEAAAKRDAADKEAVAKEEAANDTAAAKKAEEEIAAKKLEEAKREALKDSIEKNLKMIPVTMSMFSTMGCVDNSGDCNEDERPTQNISLSEYYISEAPVTQRLWLLVMGARPRTKFSGPDLPVESVSWNEVQEFISKLRHITGKNYRLPTEAEWEFAARGGSNSKKRKFSGDDDIDSVAWYNANSNQKTHKVCTKNRNELGICDMSGNVWEWVQDWKGNYSGSSLQSDPSGSPTGVNRIYRGCSWQSVVSDCRVSRRSGNKPSYKSSALGFRLVLIP